MQNSFELQNFSHIGEEYRASISKIMTKCQVNVEDAYEALILNNFDVEKTIKQLSKQHHVSKPEQKKDKKKIANTRSVNNEIYIDADIEGDSDEQYQQYYYFQKSTGVPKYFYQKYPIDIKLIDRKSHARNQLASSKDTLFPKLNDMIKPTANLPKNQVSSLEEAFCVSYHEKIPVLILITDMRSEIQQNLMELMRDTPDIKYKMSSEFIYFGIYKDAYKLQKWLEKHIKLKDNMNSIVIGRVNLYEDIQIISKLSLQQNIPDLLISLKRIKSNCIQLALDDKYMQLKHKMFQQGKYWRRPATFKQRSKKKKQHKKLLSDQKIRRQQEQIYKVIQKETVNQGQKNNKKEARTQQNKQLCLKMREQKRKKLKVYDQGVRFKIRMPSGANFFVTVCKEQKVQYLFDFIQCREEQLGFQDQVTRKFDIFIGFGESDSLQGKQKELIGSLFQDSVFLAVRQLFE